MQQIMDMDEPDANIAECIFQLREQLNIPEQPPDAAGITDGILGSEVDLITIIKHCPLIYDKFNVHFKDKVRKEAAWNAIASVFHVSAEDVRLRWGNLRDRFNKYKRGVSTVCPFYDELKFIEPHIMKRRRFGRKKLKRQIDDDKDNDSFVNIPSDNVTTFINAVHQFPILFTLANVEGKEAKREMAWKVVSQITGLPVTDCLGRWKSLRERFMKERRTSLDNDKAKWEYFDRLSFLDEHIRKRKRGRKSSVSADDDDDDIKLVDVKREGQNGLNCIEFVDVSSNLSCSSNSFEPSTVNVGGALNTLIAPTTPTTATGINEDDLFGQSIAAELKRIPNRRNKNKVKAEIYKLLYEYGSD